jgi:hypothetical protein
MNLSNDIDKKETHIEKKSDSSAVGAAAAINDKLDTNNDITSIRIVDLNN